MNKKLIVSSISLAIFVVVSCVTVNVNFPEGVVQKAADDYVRDLYKARQDSKEETKKELKPQSYHLYLIATAYAQAPQFKVNTPAAQNIQRRQRARVGKIDKLKTSGVIGETDKGLLAIYPKSGAKKLKLKRASKLVQEENTDREALYAEIMSSNSLPAAMDPKVRASFFNSFKSVSPSGTWMQVQGQWQKKP
jgi:uncharacterized protein YdbL (DUF1318 family)